MYIGEKLVKALEQEEFVLYLQPKYNIEEDHLSGAEILVRWEHPELGLLGPDFFLKEFESCKKLWELDCYIWRMACKMLQEWKYKGWTPGPLTTNISNQTFFHPDLVKQLIAILEEYKIDTKLLWIEIKEDAYIKNPKEAHRILDELHEAGFMIILDNFGRTTSSIKSLNEMKFDRLKVDMNFLSAGEDTEKSELILSAVIKMANWLGMSVTAECVETKEQMDFSQASGCDNIQGFYFNKPMTRIEYEETYMFQLEEEINTSRKIEDINPKHNMTILVIDDSEMERSLVQKYLQDEFRIHACASAETGLAYLKKHINKVHLILIDYIMPGMSGMDFLRICNEDEALKAIPKIMITAKEDPKAQIEAFRIGAYDYLTKPLIPEIVRARIYHSMEVHKQLKESIHVGEQYRHQAQIDKATGLLNKGTFQNETIENISKDMENYKALFVIDIDDFKDINDQYGHLKGDGVIKVIAKVLKANFRSSDLVGRFGGDEFVVLMTSMKDKEMVHQKASAVMDAVVSGCQEELGIKTSVSVGITFFRADDSFDSLFQRADEALYEAKKDGKEKTVVCE